MSKRSRTRERRKEREQERKRKRMQYIIGGVVVAVVIFLGLAVVMNQPTEADIPEEILERYGDIAVSQTTEGYYRLGSSDAPVRVEEYSSFSCPGCENFHRTVFPALLERVEAGEINFTYIPLQTGSIPNAEGAARTALCAGQQGRFWEMHDVLFEWHSLYGNNAYNNSRISASVNGLGLDSGQFNSCFDSSEISQVLVTAQSEGVNSTPSVAVNDTLLEVASLEELTAAIDSALAFAPPVQIEEEPEATEEAEMEATEEVEMEATEEMDDAEATEEAEMEATEEMDDAEATEEADDNADAQSADDEAGEADEADENDEAEEDES